RQLGKLIRRIGPLRLAPEASGHPFESLAEAIVYQQLHGKAAAAILARVQALFDTRRPFTPEEILGASVARLRSAGLSASKTAALQDLARKTLEGVVPDQERLEGMTDEAIIERITAVRGIGRWTAQMLLIFRLGRPDVLPSQDFGIRKGFAVLTGKAMPTPAQVERRGERWRPFRTVAAWYLWRATEL
ncbi:MAG: DNA-3-methyladenine glycosylase 2 family protein, partial [Candidatus Rokubacteria bacterium]|nr:DNA-3-methyladenine glycosylase 2 family protein [Candidatus Rokubacteria bacterium]